MDFGWTLVAIAVAAVVLRALLTRGERHYDARPPQRPAEQPNEADVQAFLRDGRKIEAIKAYRALHGVDLVDAKEAVEQLARQLRPGR